MPTSLDDVLARFAPLTTLGEPANVQYTRGLVLTLAQHLMIHLPDGAAKDKSIDALVDVMDRACEAYASA